MVAILVMVMHIILVWLFRTVLWSDIYPVVQFFIVGPAPLYTWICMFQKDLQNKKMLSAFFNTTFMTS
jgi:hypothetical protein